jgi:predicted DNA-binding WGR domain protein
MSKGMKISKTFADFKDVKPDYEERLELFEKGENHNKFYRLAVYGKVVVRHWGRHGSNGQQMAEEFYSDWEAMGEGRDLVRLKKNKGYGPEASLLDVVAREVNL